MSMWGSEDKKSITGKLVGDGIKSSCVLSALIWVVSREAVVGARCEESVNNNHHFRDTMCILQTARERASLTMRSMKGRESGERQVRRKWKVQTWDINLCSRLERERNKGHSIKKLKTGEKIGVTMQSERVVKGMGEYNTDNGCKMCCPKEKE